MLFSDIASYIRDRRAKRAHYKRLVAEIQGLSERDLADLRADRDDMLRHAYHEVYR